MSIFPLVSLRAGSRPRLSSKIPPLKTAQNFLSAAAGKRLNWPCKDLLPSFRGERWAHWQNKSSHAFIFSFYQLFTFKFCRLFYTPRYFFIFAFGTAILKMLQLEKRQLCFCGVLSPDWDNFQLAEIWMFEKFPVKKTFKTFSKLTFFFPVAEDRVRSFILDQLEEIQFLLFRTKQDSCFLMQHYALNHNCTRCSTNFSWISFYLILDAS